MVQFAGRGQPLPTCRQDHFGSKHHQRQHCSSCSHSAPPLDEQRRIAAIFDRADRLRTKRSLVLAALDHLPQSLFNDTFRKAEPGWPILRFGDLCRNTQLGLVRNTKEIGPTYAHRYVRMDAISSTGKYLPQKEVRTSASDAELRKYSLESGDLIFNTRNSRELVGKSAIFRGTPALFNNNILRVRFREEIVRPEYVHGFLWSSSGRQELEQRKSGTTSVFAIYEDQLATIPVPVPPRALQDSYVAKLCATADKSAQAEVQSELLDDLSASLQFRAFTGQL